MRILIIEDEQDLADLLATALRDNCYAVDVAYDGVMGLYKSSEIEYDLIILDLNLPGMDGIKICQSIRHDKPDVFILILTARSETEDVVTGLDNGADDYMTKPFEMGELQARVRTLLRRDLRNREPIMTVRDLRLDPASRKVWFKEQPVRLNYREYSLLRYLMSRPGEVVSQEDIINHVWDEDVDLFSVSVRVHIHNLRKKIIDSNQPYIETLIGQGYRLIDEEQDDNEKV
jgi:DNA-binding response OmpR family regulator